jgi:hypothetical protein
MSSCARVLALGLVLSALACEREAVDGEPARLVEEFVLRMQRVHGDPVAARAAYDLLWTPARENLTERAKRASAVSGRKVLPEEMLAPSRFFIRFLPKNYRAEVQGEWAVVTIKEEGPEPRRQLVKCVIEQGRWRVVMELPALPSIQKRIDTAIERE